MIRLLLADDQTLMRQGLRILLSSEQDLEVVGEARNGREAVELARSLRPDIVLMDVRMPELDGVQATEQLRSAGVRVILLTTYDEDELVLRGIRAGAAGYLLKDQPSEEIVDAIRAVHRGEALFKTSGAARVLSSLANAASSESAPPRSVAHSGTEQLTAREVEVLRLIGEGLTNRNIAERMIISESTVKTHVNNIFGKLGFQDRAQAVAFAFRAGLVTGS